MGWATNHIAELNKGRTVSFRPRDPVPGKIAARQLCTIAPVDPAMLEVGDVVLCQLAGSDHLHVIKAIDGDRFQIGASGRPTNWITGEDIFGRCQVVPE